MKNNNHKYKYTKNPGHKHGAPSHHALPATQANIQSSAQIEGPGELPDRITHVFDKASEYVLSTQEKQAGAAAFKALVVKGIPASAKIGLESSGASAEAAAGASATDLVISSPYSQYVISAKKFFSEQFSAIDRSRLLKSVVLGCLIFICATSTTYAANSSLPGDLLYPIKIRLNEPIERALAFGATEKAQVAVRQAVERVKEASELSMAGKIDPVTQDLINAGIIAKSEAARQSIFFLQEQQAQENGQADAGGRAINQQHDGRIAPNSAQTAQNISAVFENSVAAYKKNIEAYSNSSSSLAASSSMDIGATPKGRSVLRILNTLNFEIQKIKDQAGGNQGEDSERGELINNATNLQQNSDSRKSWQRSNHRSYNVNQAEIRAQASTSVTNAAGVSGTAHPSGAAHASIEAGATSGLDASGTRTIIATTTSPAQPAAATTSATPASVTVVSPSVTVTVPSVSAPAAVISVPAASVQVSVPAAVPSVSAPSVSSLFK